MSKKILIVDDDFDLVTILKHRFQKRGFEVFTAHDGNTGLQTANTVQPDLILLDINLPGKSGLQLYNQLRTSHGRSKYPTIIFTGRSELGDMFHGIQVDGFITKPFEIADLFNEVDRVIKRPDDPTIVLLDSEGQAKVENLIRGLRDNRYHAIVAEGIDELLNQIGSRKVIAVLMEYLQKDARGDDFIRTLKEAVSALPEANKPAGGRIPVIVYSFSGMDYHEKSLAAGADRYIGKPKTATEVIAVIRAMETNLEPGVDTSHQ